MLAAVLRLVDADARLAAGACSGSPHRCRGRACLACFLSPGSSVRIPTEFWSSLRADLLPVRVRVGGVVRPPDAAAGDAGPEAAVVGVAVRIGDERGHAARRVVGGAGEGDHAGLGRVLRRAVELPLRARRSAAAARAARRRDVAGGDPVERRSRARDDLVGIALAGYVLLCGSPLLERGRPFTDDLCGAVLADSHRLRHRPSRMIPGPEPEDFPRAGRGSGRPRRPARKTRPSRRPCAFSSSNLPLSVVTMDRGATPLNGPPRLYDGAL